MLVCEDDIRRARHHCRHLIDALLAARALTLIMACKIACYAIVALIYWKISEGVATASPSGSRNDRATQV